MPCCAGVAPVAPGDAGGARAGGICRPVAAMTEAARSIVDNADSEDIFASVNTERLRAGDDEIGDLGTGGQGPCDGPDTPKGVWLFEGPQL